MKNIMKEAHRLTREIKKEFPEVDYQAQLGICLSFLYNEGAEEAEEKEEETLEIGTWSSKFEVRATERIETSEGIFNMPTVVFDPSLSIGGVELTFWYKTWEKYGKTRIYFHDDADGFIEIKNGKIVKVCDSGHCAAGRAVVRAVAESIEKLRA